jgi:putative ABC transport system ATP-binding protein
LADEPNGNLDNETSAAVLRLMKDLNCRQGQTILMIAHDSDAAGYADRVVRMRGGCIV